MKSIVVTLILLCVVSIIGCVETTVHESEAMPVFELKLIDTEGKTYTIRDVYDFNISQTETTEYSVDAYYYVTPEYTSPEYDIDLYKAHIQYQGITEYGVGDTYYIKAYYT